MLQKKKKTTTQENTAKNVLPKIAVKNFSVYRNLLYTISCFHRKAYDCLSLISTTSQQRTQVMLWVGLEKHCHDVSGALTGKIHRSSIECCIYPAEYTTDGT